MNNVEELEQRISELEDFLKKAFEHKAEWKRERDKYQAELEDAFDSGSGTYKLSVKVTEAESGFNHWASKVSRYEAELKELRQELDLAKLPEHREEAQEARREARRVIQEQEERLIEAVKNTYQRARQAQFEANRVVRQFNSHATRTRSASKLPQVKRMNGLSNFDYAANILRAVLAEGGLK